MKGIIGFFDILGYQNFLENNSEIEYAKKIIELIERLQKTFYKISEMVILVLR
ncbi:hypothetical protein [Nitrosomonas ureae]|uniref:Guanylate cyclase domain-containing protein n=1 Tax=Nitrosomonas ureae TaxID=44577 RepID=A0A1H5WEZ3_9PROT|nr:hypothetical protein [Nitrosomonas ureae]SEF97938.1 hypothetical protein SAMN05216334_11817 [Nitrosomonas ureae]